MSVFPNDTALPKSTLTINAYGYTDNGSPTIDLIINGVRQHLDQTVTGQQEIKFSFDAPTDIQTIGIEYFGDDGSGRAVSISSVKINGISLNPTSGFEWAGGDAYASDANLWVDCQYYFNVAGRDDLFPTPPDPTGINWIGTGGAEQYHGTDNADTLDGAGGNDTLYGGASGDSLIGGQNMDRLLGEDGKDTLSGGEGNDFLDGGAGSDTMVGGIGSDSYIVDKASDVLIEESSNNGADTVFLSASYHDSSWVTPANIENIRIMLGSAQNMMVAGNDLNNSISDFNSSNWLQGLGGNDILIASLHDTLEGGTGDDTYYVYDETTVVLEKTNQGHDTEISFINLTLATNVEELDLLGFDNLLGTGNSLDNQIFGNDGDNRIDGLKGDDTLSGGAGNDTIDGGAGNDVLKGDGGADLFHFSKNSGHDTIVDFNPAEGDRIDLSGTGIFQFSQIKVTWQADISKYVVDLGNGTTITLAADGDPCKWFKYDNPTVDSAPEGQILNWEGIALPSYSGGRFIASGGQAAMDQIKATGANSISLVPNFFQNNGSSTSMGLNPGESDTMEQVKNAILEAEARGLNVILKPHLERNDRESVGDSAWRGLIAPSDPALWFQNYKAMMVQYAKVAQDAGAAMVCVGTEMKSMTNPYATDEYGVSYTQHWIDIISAVRSVYSGKVTYAATDEEAKKIQFWDKVDYIGVDAYFGMTNVNNPTVDQLVDSWTKPVTNSASQAIYGTTSVVDTWKNLSEAWNKKVIFTEIGYGSYDGVNQSPGSLSGSKPQDYQEQKDCYDALFKVIKNYGGQWLDGAFLWSYQTFEHPIQDGGLSAMDYTPQDKPANAVITAAYSSPQHVAGLTLNGLSGSEKLDGGYNNDTLFGNGGNDTLWGGAGNDVLNGGAGADRFQFGGSSGSDIIQDFAVAQAGELIAITKNINGTGIKTFEQLQAHMSMTGSNTVIHLGHGNSITLLNVNKADLTSADFIFI